MAQAHSALTHPGQYTQADREAFALAYYQLGSKVRASMEAGVPPAVAAKWIEQKWFIAAQESIKREFDARMDSRISGIVDNALGAIQDRLENGDEKVTKYGIVKAKPGLAAVANATGLLLDRRAKLRSDPLAGNHTPVQDDHLERIAKKLKEFMQTPTQAEEEARTIDAEDIEFEDFGDLADLE